MRIKPAIPSETERIYPYGRARPALGRIAGARGSDPVGLRADCRGRGPPARVEYRGRGQRPGGSRLRGVRSYRSRGRWRGCAAGKRGSPATSLDAVVAGAGTCRSRRDRGRRNTKAYIDSAPIRTRDSPGAPSLSSGSVGSATEKITRFRLSSTYSLDQQY